METNQQQSPMTPPPDRSGTQTLETSLDVFLEAMRDHLESQRVITVCLEGFERYLTGNVEVPLLNGKIAILRGSIRELTDYLDTLNVPSNLPDEIKEELEDITSTSLRLISLMTTDLDESVRLRSSLEH